MHYIGQQGTFSDLSPRTICSKKVGLQTRDNDTLVSSSDKKSVLVMYVWIRRSPSDVHGAEAEDEDIPETRSEFCDHPTVT